MREDSRERSPHFELLNLIGYGLAKFSDADNAFHKQFGFAAKEAFFADIVARGIAKTKNTVKGYQDVFDPFFPNPRPGWKERKDWYRHRKVYIDSLFGALDVAEFAAVVQARLDGDAEQAAQDERASPIAYSKFAKLQSTGLKAELFFMATYQNIAQFNGGELEDARLLGDGYDFQIRRNGRYFLAEVKGVSEKGGGIRLTEKEYRKAQIYKERYGVVVVSNLIENPVMTPIFNPVAALNLTEYRREAPQVEYRTTSLNWHKWSGQ